MSTQEKHKLTCEEIFGKKRMDLTPDELRKYNRIKKAESRRDSEEQREKDREYARHYVETHKDEIARYREEHREAKNEKRRQRYREQYPKTQYDETALSREMFGVSVRKMTPEQYRVYNAECARRWRDKVKAKGQLTAKSTKLTDRYEKCLSRKLFGVPVSEMTKEQRTEYAKVRKMLRTKLAQETSENQPQA